MSCADKDCHAALIELESLGLEEWTAQHTLALRHVVEACPACNQEWGFFRQSILVVSTTSQLLPSPDQTRLMWQTCSAQIRRLPTERGVEPRFIESSPSAVPFWKNWFSPQPASGSAFGWVALGAATALLAGVWFLAPDTSVSSAPVVALAPLPQVQNANDLEGSAVSFQRPPAMASTLVNNHSMMGAAPFSNYAGSSLVSYSAVSSPAPRP